MDDSDGGATIIMEKCYEYWLESISNSDIDTKRGIYEFLRNEIIQDHGNFTYYIEELVFEEFSENEFLINKKQLCENMIKTSENSAYKYELEKWSMRYIFLLNELNIDQKVIDDFINKNLYLSDIRKYCAQNHIDNNNYEKAIVLLKEGKIVDAEHLGIVSEYSSMLKSIYKELNRTDEYIEELKNLLVRHLWLDMNIYKELKGQFPEEGWKKELDNLIETLPKHIQLDKVFIEEGMYENLLSIVLDSNDLSLLLEYEDTLKNIYPDELLHKYEITLNEMARISNNRRQYQNVIKLLRRMKEYPNGEERMQSIASQWKVEYKKRRAMMDELGKL